MLSRKPETTNTIASSANAPVQSSGSQAGNAFGRPLSSKCAASSAKPTSSRKQVHEDHPLVREVGREPAEAGPGREAGDQPLERDDGREAGGRDRQRTAMEQRDAHERHAEDQELERKAQRTCGQSQSAAVGAAAAVFMARPGAAAHEAARPRRGRLAVLEREHAVHDHVRDARSRTGAAPRRSRGPGSSRGRRRRRRRSGRPSAGRRGRAG